jgi:hypothetical protein
LVFYYPSVLLDRSPSLSGIKAEVYFNRWHEDCKRDCVAGADVPPEGAQPTFLQDEEIESTLGAVKK